MNNKTNSGSKLKDSKIWKETIGALDKFWDNYLRMLATYFRKMSRIQQEELITKYCWIISIGAVVWAWCVIEPLLHSFGIIFIIGLPLSVGLAFLFAKRVVAPMMIERLSKYLND